MKIKNNVTFVGKIDWELRKFHGDEYSTHKGSSYNSYLIEEEKTVLLDTVWTPYATEWLDHLQRTVDLQKIDAVVMHHNENDHSGGLPALMAKIPDVPVYCTKNGEKFIRGLYHLDLNYNVVKTGDKIELGNGKELVFVEAPMLHWPDTMMSYLTGDNILFSNDGFGQHYASEVLFNDLVDQCELDVECLKYYANILTPFAGQVKKKINEILGMGLPVDMICPSHGVIWRQNPTQIVEKYLQWADHYQENQITLIYDTMWQSTRIMAEEIAAGIQDTDKEVAIKLYNLSKSDKNDVITEIFKSKAILVGSATINNGYLVSVAGILEEIRGLKFKNKKAAAFGSYGWSGEAVKMINGELDKAGFARVNDGLRLTWNPDTKQQEICRQFGREFVSLLEEPSNG